MSKLWIYGDSFARDYQESWQWQHLLLDLLEDHNEISIQALEGVGNDWIAEQVNITEQSWTARDTVIVITTEQTRQWWFQDHPQYSNIYSMWGHPDVQLLEKQQPNLVNAVGFYLNYLQRWNLDAQRITHWVSHLELLAQQHQVSMRIIPGFDCQPHPRFLPRVRGDLTEVCNQEFVNHRHQQAWFKNGTDTRANHLSRQNHLILAEKLRRSLTDRTDIDLDHGFRTEFLSVNDKHTSQHLLCHKLIELSKYRDEHYTD